MERNRTNSRPFGLSSSAHPHPHHHPHSHSHPRQSVHGNRRRRSPTASRRSLQMPQHYQQRQPEQRPVSGDDELMMMKVVAARMEHLGLTHTSSVNAEEIARAGAGAGAGVGAGGNFDIMPMPASPGVGIRGGSNWGTPHTHGSSSGSGSGRRSSVRRSYARNSTLPTITTSAIPPPQPVVGARAMEDPVLMKIIAERSSEEQAHRSAAPTVPRRVTGVPASDPAQPYVQDYDEEMRVLEHKLLRQQASPGSASEDYEAVGIQIERKLLSERRSVPQESAPAPAPAQPGAYACTPNSSTHPPLMLSRHSSHVGESCHTMGFLTSDSSDDDMDLEVDVDVNAEMDYESADDMVPPSEHQRFRRRDSRCSTSDDCHSSFENTSQHSVTVENLDDVQVQETPANSNRNASDHTSICPSVSTGQTALESHPNNQSKRSLFGNGEDDDDDSPTCFGYVVCLLVTLLALTAIIIVIVKPSFIYKVGADEEGAGMEQTGAPQQIFATKEEALEAFRQSLSPATLEQIDDNPTSSQSAAFRWISEDPFLLDLPQWRHQQRFALATTYHGLDGTDWPFQDQWLSYEIPECEWFMNYGASNCQGDSFVRLVLSNMPNLKGSLPQELALLTGLQEIKLTKMPRSLLLTELLPLAHLQPLSSLKVIDLTYTNLHGSTLPTELGMLSQLKELYIGSAYLGGSLPTQLAQMSSLETLVLSDNQLTGPLPDSWAAPKLETVWMQENQLSGSLPNNWGASLPSLLSLSLHYNNFTGTLPSEWGHDMDNILDLKLGFNRLSGSIPPEWGGMAVSLKNLGLQGNEELSGTIPVELCAQTKQDNIAFSVDCDNVLCCFDTSDEYTQHEINAFYAEKEEAENP